MRGEAAGPRALEEARDPVAGGEGEEEQRERLRERGLGCAGARAGTAAAAADPRRPRPAPASGARAGQPGREREREREPRARREAGSWAGSMRVCARALARVKLQECRTFARTATVYPSHVTDHPLHM